MDELILKESEYSLRYWKLYYHLLLYLHYALGIAGIVIGAIIATGNTIGFTSIGTQGLGVLSTVIVGIVSFAQPGRMASVFYDAYWRLRIAILRSHCPTAERVDLIEALSSGYATVATIQPEALRKHVEADSMLDMRSLSAESKKRLMEKLSELVALESSGAANKSQGPLAIKAEEN